MSKNAKNARKLATARQYAGQKGPSATLAKHGKNKKNRLVPERKKKQQDEGQE